LVLAPQLDAKENLILSQQIDSGNLPKEPYYRALLYPLSLSLIEPAELRPLLGSVLGILCHLLNGWLTYAIAWRIWKSRMAATVGACLYLVNPASLLFSLLLLDMTPALSLFLLAILSLLKDRKGISPYLLSGLLGGLAVLARPHFLPAVLMLPVFCLILQKRLEWKAFSAWLPLSLILITHGLLNLQHSGEFRILPWQGAYNLWAANKSGANGLYFKQSVNLSNRGNEDNPTKVESIYLYGTDHPEIAPPYSVHEMNEYWRGKFSHRLIESPVQVIRLWMFKGYAVFNSFEQYNNITFSFHKSSLPLLKYNPVNWGILLILGALGLFHLFRKHPHSAASLLFVFLAYSAILILFFASARFRLPLVPFLAVMAGGIPVWLPELWHSRKNLIPSILLVITTGCIAYSSFAGIRNTDTYIQDRLLLANAHADMGQDFPAADWARKVLAESPGRTEAQRIYTISYFNLRITGNLKYAEFGNWEDQQGWVELSSTSDPALATIYGFYQWHWGNKDSAMAVWRQIKQHNPGQAGIASTALHVIDSETGEFTEEQMIIHRLLNDN